MDGKKGICSVVVAKVFQSNEHLPTFPIASQHFRIFISILETLCKHFFVDILT